METKTIEEKVKTIILEEVRNLADDAWCNPTDDNICKLFNAVEYLKKVLKNDNYSSQIPTWNHSQIPTSNLKDPRLTDNNATVRARKSSDTGDSNFIAQEENSKTNNDDNIFNTYL